MWFALRWNSAMASLDKSLSTKYKCFFQHIDQFNTVCHNDLGPFSFRAFWCRESLTAMHLLFLKNSEFHVWWVRIYTADHVIATFGFQNFQKFRARSYIRISQKNSTWKVPNDFGISRIPPSSCFDRISECSSPTEHL